MHIPSELPWRLVPLDAPFQPWKDLRPLRRNPLLSLAAALRREDPYHVVREPERLTQAHAHFYNTASRTLVELKLLLELHFRFEPTDAAHARARRHAFRFFYDDLASLLLTARILCDRSLFLVRKAHPSAANAVSFTSFAQHREKLVKGASLPAALGPWRSYVVDQTDWFPVLKRLRDKFIVHQGSPHTLVVVLQSQNDVGFRFRVSDGTDPTRLSASTDYDYISARGVVAAMLEYLQAVANATSSAFYGGPAVK